MVKLSRSIRSSNNISVLTATTSKTTGMSPFFANKGYHLNITIHPKMDLASNRAQEYAINLGELHEYLKTEMTEAQHRFQTAADARHMLLPNFTLGECTYVKEHYFHT